MYIVGVGGGAYLEFCYPDLTTVPHNGLNSNDKHDNVSLIKVTHMKYSLH